MVEIDKELLEEILSYVIITGVLYKYRTGEAATKAGELEEKINKILNKDEGISTTDAGK